MSGRNSIVIIPLFIYFMYKLFTHGYNYIYHCFIECKSGIYIECEKDEHFEMFTFFERFFGMSSILIIFILIIVVTISLFNIFHNKIWKSDNIKVLLLLDRYFSFDEEKRNYAKLLLKNNHER